LRVVDGYRSGSDVRGTRKRITYGVSSDMSISQAVAALLPRTRQWAVVWCDHESWPIWRDAFAARKWYVFAPVVWVKTGACPRFTSDGPACSCEYLCVARPRGWPSRRASRPGHYLVGRVPKAERIGLVGQKPVASVRRVIEDYSEPGELICDPYAGSGTTLIAAELTGRDAIGAEIDPAIHALAAERIAKECP
jgi:site-specific DNA-methyltransferase (adenine-specific)